MNERPGPGSAPRETAVGRMQRVLAAILWIAEHDGPLVSEAAEHFGVTDAVLLADLELACMIGADSDDFLEMPVEMYLEGDRVFVHLHAFDRPLQLTPPEALSLVVAGSALSGVGTAEESGHDRAPALHRALEKVAAALGIEVGEQVDIDLGVRDAAVFATVQSAVDEHRAVQIVHLNVERDTRTQRVVEPWSLFRERGSWYLLGHCRRAVGERQFRVDRIVAADLLAETTTVPADLPPPSALRVDADAPRMVVDLGPDAYWVVESYPVESVDPQPDGTLRTTLVVVSRHWAERLLLRLGLSARLVHLDPALGPGDPGVEAARRVLARYGTGGAQH